MRVGVTGGTGFLGSRLVDRLRRRGDAPVVFARNPSRAAALLGVECRGWDATRVMPPDPLQDLDAVVHLAGETVLGIWNEAKKQKVRDVRVLGTRHLVQGLRDANPRPRILLSSSASGYYGEGGESVLTEASPRGTGFLADLCVDWEAEAAAAEALEVRVVFLRTTLPLDTGGGILRGLLLPFRLGLGGALGHGRQWMPWIHIEDWLDMVLFALDQDAPRGPLNLSAPHPVRNEELTRTLARVLRRPAFLRVPTFLLARSEQGRGALMSQRIVPAKADALGFRFRHPDLEEALRSLLNRG
jgi:uncharacterized protein